MDAPLPIDEDGPDNYHVDLLHHIEAIFRLMRQGICGACRGDGICVLCRGNGRFLIDGLGFYDCATCIGDGACMVCHGTGKLQLQQGHA